MDRSLLLLAVAGLLAPGLAGCIDASALPFADSDTVIEVPPLSHGQHAVVDRQTPMLASDESGAKIVIADVQTTSTVLDDVIMTLDRYAEPVEAVAIRHASIVQSPHSAVPGNAWTSGTTIETGGGTLIHDGASRPFAWTFGAQGPSDFSQWCTASIVTPGGVPTFGSKPIRYDDVALYGSVLTADDEVTRTYETTFRTGHEGPVDATVTRTWKPVGTDEVDIVLDGQSVTLPAIEYQVRTQVDSGDEDGGETEVRLPHVWYADGVAEPVRTTSWIRVQTGWQMVESRLVSFTTGHTPVSVGTGAPAAQYEGVHPMADRGPWEFSPGLERVDVQFAFSDAMAAVEEDLFAYESRAWMDAHPEAVVGSAEYQRDPANGTFWWHVDLYGEDSVLSMTIRRATPDYHWQSEDRVTDEYVWDDPVFHVPPDKIRGYHVVDAATAFDVARAFAPGSWAAFSYETRAPPHASVSPTTYALGVGGHEEKQGLLLGGSQEKHWRGWMVSIDGATGAASAQYGASLSCGTGGGLLGF